MIRNVYIDICEENQRQVTLSELSSEELSELSDDCMDLLKRITNQRLLTKLCSDDSHEPGDNNCSCQHCLQMKKKVYEMTYFTFDEQQQP